MVRRSFTIIVFVLTALAVGAEASPLQAQSDPHLPNPHFRTNPHWVEPPANLSRAPRGDRGRNLDFLFGALKAAPDDVSAKHIEDRIWSQWLASGSDTVALLMSRTKNAVESADLALAIRLLDAIIEIRPQYVEAWNRRATVFFMKKDFSSALSDLRHVLAREPRHFGALSGLAMIQQELGDDKAALDAYRRALAVHPHLKGVAEKVRTLTDKVEGRAI